MKQLTEYVKFCKQEYLRASSKVIVLKQIVYLLKPTNAKKVVIVFNCF